MVSFPVAILSGMVISGAFAPLNWWFLLPVAIAMFLYSVTKTRRPFLVSFVFAIVFNFLSLSWSGTYVGLIPVLFLVLLQSLFYLPLGFVSYKRDRYSRIWLLLPILLIADQIRSIFPFGGFGWNRLSFSQADAPYLKLAAYLGDTSLVFVGVCLGIALYLLFARAQLLSVALTFMMATGIIMLPSSELNQGSVKVLAIQGNVPRLGLDFNARAEEVFNYHLKKTTAVLQDTNIKPDVIAWPENSVDVDPFTNRNVGEKIAKLAEKASAPVIVGAVLKDSQGPRNVSIMWNQQGRVVSQYSKRVLTPFGEYIPLRRIAQFVSPYTDNVVDFVPGKTLTLHRIDKFSIAPILCYEIIDDSAVQSISKLSNLILVQTNNATFADSGQSAQQLNISRIRAVENNRWIVSVSTTGVSAVIDNFGTVEQITEQNTASFLYANVKLSSKESFSSRIGDWTFLICLAMSLLIYIKKRTKNA